MILPLNHETFLILLATLTDDLCLSANEIKSDVTFGVQIVNYGVNRKLEKQETFFMYIFSLNRLLNDNLGAEILFSKRIVFVS